MLMVWELGSSTSDVTSSEDSLKIEVTISSRPSIDLKVSWFGTNKLINQMDVI